MHRIKPTNAQTPERKKCLLVSSISASSYHSAMWLPANSMASHLKTTEWPHIDWQHAIWLREVCRMNQELMWLPVWLQCIFVCLPEAKQFNSRPFTILIIKGCSSSVLHALAKLSQQVWWFYLLFI